MGPSNLTPREQDVCTLVLAGRTNREVAAELFLTTKTVEFHLHNVYAKLGVAGRQELRRRQAQLERSQRRQGQ
jgi:DNA-binding CsgD family transcriptional regulator